MFYYIVACFYESFSHCINSSQSPSGGECKLCSLIPFLILSYFHVPQMGLATLFSCCQPIISVLLSIIYSIQLFSSLRFHLLRPSPKMYPKLISGELCPYLYHRIFKAKFWAQTRARNSHFTGSYSQASKIGFGYRFHSNLSSTGRPKIVPKRSSKEGGT